MFPMYGIRQQSWQHTLKLFHPGCFPFCSESLKTLITETMIRWAQDTEMQNPELVRAVFSLLYRQYQGLGGQMAGALACTYTISQASVEDTMSLLSSLSQIRTLLSVRMSKEEEKLMIRKLGYKLSLTQHCLFFIFPTISVIKYVFW